MLWAAVPKLASFEVVFGAVMTLLFIACASMYVWGKRRTADAQREDERKREDYFARVRAFGSGLIKGITEYGAVIENEAGGRLLVSINGCAALPGDRVGPESADRWRIVPSWSYGRGYLCLE